MLGSGRWPPLAVPSAPEQPLGWSGGKYFYFLRTGFPAPREGTHARMLRNIPLRLLPRRGEDGSGGSSGSVAFASQLALAAEEQQQAGGGGRLPPAPGAAPAPAGFVDASIVDAFDDWHRDRARSILHKIRFHAGDFCGLWRSPEQRVRESVRRLHYDPYERRAAAAAARPTNEATAADAEAAARRTERRRLTADELGALCRRLATDDRRTRTAAAEQLATAAAARPKATIDAAALRALVQRLSKESPPGGAAASDDGALRQPQQQQQQQRLSSEEIERLVARLSVYDETKWPPESWRSRKLKQSKTRKARRATAPHPAASDAGRGFALPATPSEADDAMSAAAEVSSLRPADTAASVGETVLSRTAAEDS